MQQGYKGQQTKANRSIIAKGRDKYHRSHKDAAVGATRDATKEARTAAKFGWIPRQTKRSRD